MLQGINANETIPLDHKVSDDLYRWITAEAFDGF
jgi:hypothetical protein